MVKKKPVRKRKKKGQYSKILVACLVLSNVIVMGVCLWLLDRTGMEAAALAGLWFSWTTAELACLKSIRTTKEHAKVKEKEISLKYNDESQEEESEA